jgi:hypothetical protein
MKTRGLYELVDDPSDSDLLFEIEFTFQPRSDGRLSLAIRDQKTHAVLWARTEHIQPAALKRNQDKNFDEALGRLVSAVEHLTAPSAAATAAP